MRPLLVGVLGLLMLIVLSPAAGGAQEESEQLEKLTIATEADKGNLTPYSFRPPPGLHAELTSLVHDTLFLDPYTEEPIPWLATEASASSDAKTWTVTLRDDVTWHDGEEFTADDVAFTYEYYKEGPSNRYSHHAHEYPVIESVETLDASTVEFTCADPCPTLQLITLADLPILPEHIWENVEDPQTYTELPVGTGPYKLVEYVEDQSYRLEANEDYFLGPPAVQEIEMPIVTDPSSMFLALETGQVDTVTRNIPPEIEERLAETEDIEMVEGDRFSSVFLRFNSETPPLDQQEFRRAFDMAIDRQALVDTVLLGSGTPGSPSFLHPDSRWYESQEASFDPEQANTILDEAGITDSDEDGVREIDGEPVNLSVLVPANDPQQIRTAELVAQQLEEVGVGLEVESLDPGTLSQRQNSQDFELSTFQGVPHLLGDPTQLMESLTSLLFYANPDYEELKSEWSEATTIEEQSEKLSEIQTLFSEDPPAFTLYYPDTNYAYNTSVYDGWIPVKGHGIHHKWSLIPQAAELLDE
ncbi:MAG: Oligopeptide ABC transporter, periplasmic oligopeptide-binding protein OppA [uncultured Rubrobacteraceae bacterium]|uniref:Oligopeptide ABC transporter, periplasmic oligopeptide-binding protein OppA n=1 Tax=uncultured Rubrobacteraceae bacterium TaxID=349277 RepID=A0A6J4Q430_9ACTN|nr:MAG: Oligopeptide ABC transporter, periplasmic oligopeptide-binding protein OppA [uncultured Rubrobacteraceae bacterium]